MFRIYAPESENKINMNRPVRVTSARCSSSANSCRVSTSVVRVKIVNKLEVTEAYIGIIRVKNGCPFITETVALSSFDGTCTIDLDVDQNLIYSILYDNVIYIQYCPQSSIKISILDIF